MAVFSVQLYGEAEIGLGGHLHVSVQLHWETETGLGGTYMSVFSFTERLRQVWGAPTWQCSASLRDWDRFGGHLHVSVQLHWETETGLGGTYMTVFSFTERLRQVWGAPTWQCLVFSFTERGFGGHLHGSVQIWGAPIWQCLVFSFTERLRQVWGAPTWQCSASLRDWDRFGGHLPASV